MDSLTDKLCCGCLNYGRKMVNIEYECDIRCFSQILSEIPGSCTNTILLLCYECAALLKKFSKFKQQIITSYRSFHNYELENFKYIEPEPRLHLKQLYNLSTLDSFSNNDETKIDFIKTELDEYIPLDDKELSDDEPLVKIKKKKRKNGVKLQQKELEYIEVELNKEEIEQERRVLLTKEDYINAMFRCEKCIMSFPNADDLNDHVRMKHELHSSKHKCVICECSFSTEVSYNYHTNKHIRRYECTVCSERFANKRAVMKHYNIVHCFATGVNYDFDKKIENGDINNSVQEQIFPCEFCGKTFKWRTSLRKHLETHRIETGEKRKPYCAPCRLSFTTTSNLQKHVRTSSKHQIQLKLRKLTETLPDLTTTDKQKAHLEIRSTVNKSRHQFACTQCDKRFLWRGNLLRHLHSHAAKAKGDLVCKPCNKTFSSIATYQQHMKISKKHVSENDFKFMCSDCGKRFPTKSRLRDHINWEHLKNYVYSCDECHKVFKTSNSVYLHKQVHRKDTVQHLCDHCGKPFPNHAKLRSHILGVHGGAAHSCAICGARFAWHSCLSRHVRHKHKRNIRVHTKLTETLPDLTTTDKQKAHLEIRSTVNKSRHQFACTQCDKRFLWRGNLLRHLHSHAAKAKGDLVCKPCNKTFSSIATYQQHMKISKKHVSENDFKFMCSDCGKRFPTKSRLRDHINWEHLKNYVYSCDECHKVFKTSNSVYLHKQVHRKDTVQHLCDHCGKPFPNHAKLRSHILGVHGGAAHSCAICGARFAWHSCLSRHVRHKHKRNIRVHTF